MFSRVDISEFGFRRRSLPSPYVSFFPPTDSEPHSNSLHSSLLGRFPTSLLASQRP